MPGEVLYVIDAHAVLKLQEVYEDTESLNCCLNHLTDLVKNGSLAFPDQVLKDCAKIATGETTTVWLKAVAGYRTVKSFSASWQEEVLWACPDLVDYEDQHEQTQVLVASMAMMLNYTTLMDVQIVTEDSLPLPTRSSLVEACSIIGIVTISIRDFASPGGGAGYLATT